MLASSLRLTAAEPECTRVSWILKIAFIHSINIAYCKWKKFINTLRSKSSSPIRISPIQFVHAFQVSNQNSLVSEIV